MSEKRKDGKGRILKTGESQRKDQIYQYRYTDNRGKRVCIYAPTLQELREKEKIINNFNIKAYAAGNIKLIELVGQYLDIKKNAKELTQRTIKSVYNVLKTYPISNKKVNSITKLEVKLWVADMQKNGKTMNTIRVYLSVLRCSVDLLCDDSMMLQNPFRIRIDFIKNDEREKFALSIKQQSCLLEFIKNHKIHKKYYDDILFLILTGMRFGEFSGLVEDNVDFKNKTIKIDHQLIRLKGKYKITSTKTKSSNRLIPMTENIEECLHRVLSNRRNICNIQIDGYDNFIFLNTRGGLHNTSTFDKKLKKITEDFNEVSDEKIPCISAHILRHTFCTNMINNGVDVKDVQYIMGHSNTSITLNTYTHFDFNEALQGMLTKINRIQNLYCCKTPA